uniref:Uncharacterized protein n=1 Tax=Myxococcus fulvus TaxID=33 RepID=B0YR16_MYXFU|nr:hypothetical protein pMF1.7 [Myxococcus fulvus]
MVLTREQEETVVKLQADVRSLLSRVEAVARPVDAARDLFGWLPATSLPIPGLGLLEAVRDAFGNDVQQQHVGVLREVEGRVPMWIGPDGAKYRWLMRGYRDDGTAYRPELWIDEGNAIADALATALGETHDNATWKIYADTVDKTEEELASAGRAVVEAAVEIPKAVVGPWSWKVKLALGVTGGIAAVGLGTIAWQAMRATPLGLAARGAGLVLRTGAQPLERAARAAGARVAQAVVEAEESRRTTKGGKAK